ncbi:putative alpha-N-acetylglucosaminidase [Pseudomassariella vexata]|uniref:Putative alpha-N-acetylglucosaminidase n=1 Tax=Pseudomassariella vexata TaxID=1141098 RepID=A0A1Y2E756_9PEZI|nr:putative alpha-N-acetylglucosaminidase [Pseudomassariella vexata]ORY67164.1 putative alpha-N-acetylglucosaminidase [Pseudomassariella vexata]
MHLLYVLSIAFALSYSAASATTTVEGVKALVERRLPNHTGSFSFAIVNGTASTDTGVSKPNDAFTVSNGVNGTIHVEGNSGIALATGLHWYLSNVAHVDIYWFIGSHLHLAPRPLPRLNNTYLGDSIVPWRYHFNTVTFSYTTAFWTWEDWELQLDWMALRGINLPLAWVGYEKILVDVFREVGFADTDISDFLSGPAFQAWNRFGNLQGSWGPGQLPLSWINSQFELNKKIVARMVELGMKPAMPSFTGFVPPAIYTLYKNATIVNGSAYGYEGLFPRRNTNVTFLSPSNPLFGRMQKSFIAKQKAAYGNVSHIYTLDQYNENVPFSGDLDYLRNISSNTYASLRAADPQAVWMLQGWVFYAARDFWSNTRVETYLSGVEDENMIILDLFSESQPQWQRTNNYFGKPWIWCMLHDFGGSMSLYGQVENSTVNPIQALANESSTMVGMGLTMEGQEGNEVLYDLVLDQAWSSKPIDTTTYFEDWVTSRYGPQLTVPQGLYRAWDIMRQTVYNNTNLTAAISVPKSILELQPNTSVMFDILGHSPDAMLYDHNLLLSAWMHLYSAANDDQSLWQNPAYIFDVTDITRQVLANAFNQLYHAFVTAANVSRNSSTSRTAGQKMLDLLDDLDAVLLSSGQRHFSLSDWIASARAWASPPLLGNNSDTVEPGSPAFGANMSTSQTADYYEYQARNQITIWGPTGQIPDYASKQWAGLVRSYYRKRWELFVEYTLNSTTSPEGVNEGLAVALTEFSLGWCLEKWDDEAGDGSLSAPSDGLAEVVAGVVKRWPSIFS